MSALARTALRLSVVSALNADPIISSMVQGRVYDSRMDDLASQERVPVIIVYTEDETGDQFSRNNGGPPFNSAVDLILEISIRALQPSAEGETFDIELPFTDSEMEASLDLLEERAINAIAIADTPQSRVVREEVTRRVPKMRSSRFVMNGTGDKLATRLLSLTVELKDAEEDGPFDPQQQGLFGTLPDPLRAVCNTFDAASAEYATCKALASRWPAPAGATDPVIVGADLTFELTSLSPAGNPYCDPNGPVAISVADPDKSVLLKQSIDTYER